ncbi:MAG TPA: hypothetical protein VKS99_11825 [Blastocatellia bacterium]|nr:hypothetical protein [Blastocatellia bacterium]
MQLNGSVDMNQPLRTKIEDRGWKIEDRVIAQGDPRSSILAV